MIRNRETGSVVYSPVNDYISIKEGKLFFTASLQVMKLTSLQDYKENKIVGTAWSSFYVVGSAENVHCTVLLCISYGRGSVTYYELLKPNENFTAELYRTKLKQLSPDLCKRCPQYDQIHDEMILQHENGWSHNAKLVNFYLETRRW